MNYKDLAENILNYVGGSSNIEGLGHCSTRLRITIKDTKKVKYAELEKLKGVLKVISGVQTQIVIGNDVLAVFEELNKLCTITSSGNAHKEKLNKKDIGNKVLEFMMAIFYPLIPAMAGAGILKSILVLGSMVGIFSSNSSTYIILGYISDAVFYFLPLMIAFTAADKLKCDKIIAVSATAILLLPNMINLMGAEGGTTLLGFTVKNINYATQVFPAILCTLCCYFVERLANKYIPKVLKVIFVPLITFVITVPLTILVLGPLGNTIGNYLATFLVWFQDKLGFLAVGILSAVLPLLVATGMHKSFNPITINNFTTLGYDPLYTLATLAHNCAECGATLAVGIKSKNADLKNIALSGSVSASLGITEPALYGVTLTHKSVLYSVIAGSGLSGAFLGLMKVKDCVLGVTPSVFNFICFTEEGNPMNLVYAIIGLVISVVASFVFTFIFFKDTEEKSGDSTKGTETCTIETPVKGNVIPLENVADDTFSSKALGEGFAVVPEDGNVYAPCDGKVVMLQDSKHAIGLLCENGTELLIHMGIDTVQLEGKFFENYVTKGQFVTKGDLIASFDLKGLKESGYDATVCVIVTNAPNYTVKTLYSGNASNGTGALRTRLI